jgi:hypothetical protein
MDSNLVELDQTVNYIAANLNNMKTKYLLTMYSESERWNRCYAQWETEKYHDREEFDLDDEEGLIKAIACFRAEYPEGEYEVYVIQSYREWCVDEWEWTRDEEHENKMASIRKESINLAEKIKQEKKAKEIEARNKTLQEEKEAEKQKELKLLAELKAKHEK